MIESPASCGGEDRRSRRARWLAWAAVLLVVAVVVFAARRPPILDLAQQLQQIRDLGAWARGERPELRLNLAGPNKLVYPLLALGAAVGGVRLAPALTTVLVAAAWLTALHWLGAAHRRPLANVVLASGLLFGSALYAGFFSFLLGIVPLAFWSRELRHDPARSTFLALAARTLIGTLLLYLAHALWFVFGAVLVATWVLLFRFSWRELAARLVGSLPVVLLALSWSAASAGFVRHSWLMMMLSPADRIGSLAVLSTIVLGGLRGNAEPLFTALVLAWLALGALRLARDRGRGADGFLLLAGGLAAIAAVTLPDRLDWTLMLAWRWGGVAAALLLLALPAPALVPRRAALAVAVVAILGLLAVTGRAWLAFGRQEMAGFEESLTAVPRGASVVGLDVDRYSPRFFVPPFFQMYAWAAVERGARTNFSFAELPSSLLVVREPWAARGWTRELDWEPQLVQRSDLEAFDFVLLHARDRRLGEFRKRAGGPPVVAGAGAWHLLRVGRTPDGPR